jgi:2-polyprenyl-3-methyl-5-hydroxy-6-metoxy-1,4-benzoquinol methylase
MPGRALDVGCGEGWLTRALAGRGAEALGVDASEALIERARAAGGGARYEVASYEALVADPAVAAGPWGVIVCNFALLGDPLSPLLAALGARLAPEGRLVVQTVHPWMAMGESAYRGEWRVETFAGFGSSFAAQAPWAPVPWYYRPLASWIEEIARADLYVDTLAEPLHPETGRPLSLLLTCARRTQLP